MDLASVSLNDMWEMTSTILIFCSSRSSFKNDVEDVEGVLTSKVLVKGRGPAGCVGEALGDGCPSLCMYPGFVLPSHLHDDRVDEDIF